MGTGTLLNVDDNGARRYLITRLLTRAGFTVSEAGTGAEALERVSAERPDLVLLDVKLPDTTGFDVCRAIKTDPETAVARVVLLSAFFVKDGDRMTGLESGADAYLADPFDDSMLLATIRAQLRSQAIERRRASQLRLVTEAAPGLIAQFDAEGRYVFTNEAYARRYGTTPEALVGKLYREVVGDKVYEKIRPRLRAVFRGEEATWEVNFPNEPKYFEVRAAPDRGPDGTIRGVVTVAVDITARKLMERERDALLERERRAHRNADEANRAKDEFLAILSHELRTPLNVMQHAVYLLRHEQVSEKGAHIIDTLARNVELQNKLITDLLDVSRILAGKLRMEREAVDLTVVIREAIQELRPQTEAKRLLVETSLAPDAARIVGDPVRLQQVVSNLLLNAVKFTPDKGIVWVTLRREGGQVKIIVSDTGIGIRSDMLEHVFDRFRQADSTSTRRRGGLGLGLAIVRQIVELHGGTVEASSPGERRGATFTVTLPVAARERAPRDDTEREAMTAAEEYVTDLTGVRVLAVDDDRDTLSMVVAVLSDQGAIVKAVTSAGKAYVALRTFMPDVIVADIAMPDEDGYALMRRVRSETGPIHLVPAVALTALARPEDREDALAAGFQMHLRKPVAPQELTRAIAKLVTLDVNQ